MANSFFGDLAGALPQIGGAIEAGRGLFDTAKEASEAYLAGKREFHPFWEEDK